VSASFDLDPVDRLVAGAVGEPGRRTFYIQARAAGQLVTLLAEKEQVRALAESVRHLLDAVDRPPEEPAPGPQELEEPLVPEWRVGPMALHYDEERDRVVLIASEADPEDADEPAMARIVATRAQALAMAEHAERVVEAGRPTCRFCGYPIDPAGHVCPAGNGHKGIGA
jgi:uncharacterized repeat protein (TIGR03847 family)